MIIDQSKNKRHLFLLQNGVELPAGIRPLPE
jgi:hypothetical protein